MISGRRNESCRLENDTAGRGRLRPSGADGGKVEVGTSRSKGQRRNSSIEAAAAVTNAREPSSSPSA
jgi:hypothetical protein